MPAKCGTNRDVAEDAKRAEQRKQLFVEEVIKHKSSVLHAVLPEPFREAKHGIEGGLKTNATRCP